MVTHPSGTVNQDNEEMIVDTASIYQTDVKITDKMKKDAQLNLLKREQNRFNELMEKFSTQTQEGEWVGLFTTLNTIGITLYTGEQKEIRVKVFPEVFDREQVEWPAPPLSVQELFNNIQ